MKLVTDAVRFMVQSARSSTCEARIPEPRGPLAPQHVHDLLRSGQLLADDEACLLGEAFWAPLTAWAILALDAVPPKRHLPQRLDIPHDLMALSEAEHDQLRWWLRAGEQIKGPCAGAELAELADGAELESDHMVALVGGDSWFPLAQLDDRSVSPGRATAISVGQYQEHGSTRCGICLEEILVDSPVCPHCGEQPEPLSCRFPVSSRPASIPDDLPGASWLRMHWRPLLTMTAIGALLGAGVALRHLAPDRYQPPERMQAPAAAAEPACDVSCWSGEACRVGRCLWQPPNDVGHISTPLSVAGPFELADDVVDVLAIDAERYAFSHLGGVQISSTRNGAALSLVSDAPQAQKLVAVGDTIYATAPKRIYVIDKATTRVLKTIEVGSSIDELAIGAGGQRVLASLPGPRAVAVIATDYHAEVARFFFGDDRVRPVAIDETGARALATNGKLPLAGLKAPHASVRYGAVYAFDPSRLPSEQDRVRTGLAGNPADVVMAGDGTSSYVLLREKDAIVHLRTLPSGAVRQEGRMNTCRQPEELALVAAGRRIAVRCNAGRAVEVFSLTTGELLRHIPLNARVSDMVISPDGEQALLALPRDGEGRGAIGVLDLATYELQLHDISGEPHRIRLTPDGTAAVVISDRSKVAWVIR